MVLAAGLAVLAAGCSSSRSGTSEGQGSNPLLSAAATFSGPVTAGHISEPESRFTDSLPPDYTEAEYFASGTAASFRARAMPASGRWSVSVSGSAPYRTRVIVRRPAETGRFNGTVVVEWMNESAGESSPDWDYLNPELTRAGFAYVAVSAQALGVNGGTALLGSAPSGGLVKADPARYGSLHHPGDRYSYDIYAQIGRALRGAGGRSVLGGLRPRHVVAVGESQSAFFLTTFANAVQPLTHTYDGIFIHSRGGAGAPLDAGSPAAGAAPAGQRIRTDLAVPVFMFETETDLAALGYASAVQPDGGRIRVWEVAGTAHADAYIVGPFATQLGCSKPINTGPQHEVVQAAFAAFARWVAGGASPPAPAAIQLTSSSPVTFALDANGNASGGVRTPAVDVPVSTLSGLPPAGSSVICALFGSTTPFSPARLTQLYGSRAHYLALYTAALDQAISGGFILPADRAALLQQAQQVGFSA